MKCPQCGDEMENGHVSTGGIVWKRYRNWKYWDGEEMRGDFAYGFNYHTGFRCTKCELIIVRYNEDTNSRRKYDKILEQGHL